MFLELTQKTYNPHSALSYDNKYKPVYSILAEVILVRYLGGDLSLSDSCILIAPKNLKLRILEPYKNVCCNTIDSQL